MSEVNVSELTPEEREQLKKDLRVQDQKTMWKGVNGIWADFRRIGKDYSMKSAKEMSNTEKCSELKEELTAFMDERL